MKITLLVVCVIFSIGTLCHLVAGSFDSAGPIQIVSPHNHSFHLEVDELQRILNSDDIRDRHVVVVSISGAFRKGKSFLLNFFLRYLYAQYEKHNITDWIGEKQNNEVLLGFKWRAGRRPETSGVLMWSDIFTHDFENGEKVAIILLDTQGIFDGRSGIRECTTIFALNTLLSSVQIFNLMHNIQEGDLQHLQLFTEYGRLVLEQTNKKPFQYLVFLVRDWQYAYEIDYGMYGHEVIDDILAKDDEQTAEMRELRKQINSSFDEIGAFLMPHPGFAVTQQPNFTGNLKEIHPDFIKYTKELTLSIFAPENLVVKKINGHEVRARDLIPYLQSYLHLFNGQTLPEPKTVLMATREINLLILSNECIHFYIDYMQKSLNATQSYFSGNELKELHRSAKNKAIELFQTKSKFGTNELILDHQKRIEIDIEDKFNIFHLENDKMYRNYIETAKLFNEKMVNTIKAKTYSQIIDRINTKLNLSDFELLSSFEELKNTALKRFNDEKLGDHDIFKIFREKLEYDLNHLRLLLEQMLIFSEHSMESYVSCMQKSIKQIQTYFNETEFTQLHQSTKNHSMYQFQEKFGCDDLASSMQRRFQTNIGKEFLFFKQQNEIKRVEFIKKANAHNERLIQEIKAVIEEGAQAEILRTHLNEYDLNGLFLGMKDVGLEMFDAQKICDGGISKIFREKLNQDLSKLWNTLTQRNRRRNTIRIG